MNQENASYKNTILAILSKMYNSGKIPEDKKLKTGLEYLIDDQYFNKDESFQLLPPAKLILEGGFLLKEALYVNRVKNGNLKYPTNSEIDQIFENFKTLELDNNQEHPIPLLKIPFKNDNQIYNQKMMLTILVIGQEKIGKQAFITNFINVVANIKFQSVFVYEIKQINDNNKDQPQEFIITVDQPLDNQKSSSYSYICQYKLVYCPSIGNIQTDSQIFINIIKYTLENPFHAIYLIDSTTNNRLTQTQRYIHQRIFEVIPKTFSKQIFLIFTNSSENDFEAKLYLENEDLQEFNLALINQDSISKSLEINSQIDQQSPGISRVTIDQDENRHVFTFNNMVIFDFSQNIIQKYYQQIKNEERLCVKDEYILNQEKQEQEKQEQKKQEQEKQEQKKQEQLKNIIKSSFINNQKEMKQLLKKTKEMFESLKNRDEQLYLRKESQDLEISILEYIKLDNQQKNIEQEIKEKEDEITKIKHKYSIKYFKKLNATIACYQFSAIKQNCQGLECNICQKLCHSACKLIDTKKQDQECKLTIDTENQDKEIQNIKKCSKIKNNCCGHEPEQHKKTLFYEKRQVYNIIQPEQDSDNLLIPTIDEQREFKIQTMMLRRQYKKIQNEMDEQIKKIKKMLDDNSDSKCIIPVNLEKRLTFLEEIEQSNIKNNSVDKEIPKLKQIYQQLIQQIGNQNQQKKQINQTINEKNSENKNDSSNLSQHQSPQRQYSIKEDEQKKPLLSE